VATLGIMGGRESAKIEPVGLLDGVAGEVMKYNQFYLNGEDKKFKTRGGVSNRKKTLQGKGSLAQKTRGLRGS